MSNPFEDILTKLARLEEIVVNRHSDIEIITRKQLQERLGVTEPTVIRYERAGKIPRIEIGSAVRYNWPAVVESLEEDGEKKEYRHNKLPG